MINNKSKLNNNQRNDDDYKNQQMLRWLPYINNQNINWILRLKDPNRNDSCLGRSRKYCSNT